MACKCRTYIFACERSKVLQEGLKRLNKQGLYYFVIYENGIVYLERASLISGKTEDIKKEKDFLIHELIKLKEEL